jgi:hypothetical protein
MPPPPSAAERLEVKALIVVSVTASLEQVLAECQRHGLVIRSQRELSGRPGCLHYHLGRSDRPGTLELNAWQDQVWFSIHENRDCGWASALARRIAALLS